MYMYSKAVLPILMCPHCTPSCQMSPKLTIAASPRVWVRGHGLGCVQGRNRVWLSAVESRSFCVLMQLAQKRSVAEVKALMHTPESAQAALQRVQQQVGSHALCAKRISPCWSHMHQAAQTCHLRSSPWWPLPFYGILFMLEGPHVQYCGQDGWLCICLHGLT